MEDEIKPKQIVIDDPARKKKNKLKIVLPILAVIVVAAVGFWVWHNTPGFCNAICHTPMDPYNITYDQEPHAPGIDKWGNTVESTAGLLCVTHKEQGLACMDCHVPTLGEQVGEAVAWVTGNYEVKDNATYDMVLFETDLEKLVQARGIKPDEFCLNSACHNVTREDLVTLTASYTRNPHEQPHGRLECSDCHKAHRASVNTCTDCHIDAPLPEGWISTAKAKQLAA